MHLQPPLGEGATQAVLEVEAPMRLRVHLPGVEAEPAPARLLGTVQRRVGILEQGLRVAAVARMEGDAHAGGHRTRAPADEHRLGQAGGDLAGDLRRERRPGRVLDEDDELVSTEAGHGVLGPQAGRQACRDFAQQGVADVVAVAVVDQLEAVEVEEEHRQRAVVAAGDRMAETVMEQHPVGQPGPRHSHRPYDCGRCTISSASMRISRALSSPSRCIRCHPLPGS